MPVPRRGSQDHCGCTAVIAKLRFATDVAVISALQFHLAESGTYQINAKIVRETLFSGVYDL
eukprot:4317099-Pleurochrysis_carterae.AAC.1